MAPMRMSALGQKRSFNQAPLNAIWTSSPNWWAALDARAPEWLHARISPTDSRIVEIGRYGHTKGLGVGHASIYSGSDPASPSRNQASANDLGHRVSEYSLLTMLCSE